MLAVQPDDLNFIPGSHVVKTEERKQAPMWTKAGRESVFRSMFWLNEKSLLLAQLTDWRIIFF